MATAQAAIKAAQAHLKHAEREYQAALDDVSPYPSGSEDEPRAKRARVGTRRGKGKGKAKMEA